MRHRILAGLFLGAVSLCPVWSGCAEQADSGAARASDVSGDSAGTGAAGAEASTGGSVSGGGGVSASGGTLPLAGTTTAGGTAPAAAGGEPGSAGEAGAGGSAPQGECQVMLDCDDGNPCTTDACQFHHCSYTTNTTACADDQDPCTADICAVGVCTHPDNATCACKLDADCDDKNVCTDDHCNASHQCEHPNNTAACADDNSSCTTDVCAAGACSHKDNGSCGVGTPFTVDSFNSSADWLAAKTTPDQRAIVVGGINATNLEGNADLWIAEADTGTIEFGVASLVGLGKVRIVIRSAQADTGGMVFLGLWNGSAWSDKALAGYAAIPVGSYATIELPTADFGQALADVTKLRLRFAVTGGEKNWQIDEISLAK